MTEQLMQDNAPNPTEGDAASQAPRTAEATAEALYGDKQQASEGKNQQAQDSAPADDSKGDNEGKPDGDESSKGASEKYEFKPPEGKEFDAELITAFSDVAKELNLTQEAAQKVLDKMAPAMEQRQVQALETMKQSWAEASTNDQEFGGEKLAENLSVAKKALDQFGSKELRTLLNESGLGNHPEIIRFMFKAGKAISEDKYVGQSTGAGGKPLPKDFSGMASALYSNQSQH